MFQTGIKRSAFVYVNDATIFRNFCFRGLFGYLPKLFYLTKPIADSVYLQFYMTLEYVNSNIQNLLYRYNSNILCQ